MKTSPLPAPELCSQTPPAGIDPALYLWPKDNEAAWHDDYKAYHRKPMNFCHGATPLTRDIIYVTPSWDYIAKGGNHGQESWLYPVRMVDTATGVLVTRASQIGHPVTLNSVIVIDDADEPVYFDAAFAELGGKPQIIILRYFKQEDIQLKSDGPAFRLLDVGVSPPIIVEERLMFDGFYIKPEHETFKEKYDELLDRGRIPSPEFVTIKKTGDGEYILSGRAHAGYNPDGSFSHQTDFRRYKYDRESRTITEMK